jgi:hypothetical protein
LLLGALSAVTAYAIDVTVFEVNSSMNISTSN